MQIANTPENMILNQTTAGIVVMLYLITCLNDIGIDKEL